MVSIKVKRVYIPAEEEDGFRILVDRLWPRGLKKANASIDLWAKDIAPSPPLRKWFNHEPQKWETFQLRYQDELNENSYVQDFLQQIKSYKTVTLLYAAHDDEHNHALVLRHFLKQVI